MRQPDLLKGPREIVANRSEMEVNMADGWTSRVRTGFSLRSRGLVLLALPLFVSLGSAQASESRRPNIVFIFSDDHAYQAISAYGDPRRLIETPNIDRIAKEGMRFDRCLVPNSICGPSRATVLTGKYSHVNGFYNNTNSRFDGSQTTFPKLLQAAGYQTAHRRQVAPRQRPDRLRRLAHPAGAGGLLQPADDRQRAGRSSTRAT